ncbi:MAG TPA: potassium channel family protein, partial [Pirellulales bacterium]|nr:potassium channel family protein [Pirellulales bacterium]
MFAGIALVAVVLYDVFETVVVPRRTGRFLRLSPLMIRWLWPIWRRYGVRLYPAWRREDFLGTFAPLALVLLLVLWEISLIVGFGLVMHALQDQIAPKPADFPSALYFAGASLLTIGYGDIAPVGALARAAALLAGASGLAVVALVISLTFNLYGSFARREIYVLALDSRAGVPPSGVMMLETFGRYKIIDELAPSFAQLELWTAEMLDSHLAYPILPFFRSSHDGQSWVSALGAVLDAATLLITAFPADPANDSDALRKSRASAEMMYAVGVHALVDITQLLRRRLDKQIPKLPGIEQAEFETACQRLAA